MKNLLLLFSIFFISFITSNSQTCQWAEKIAGTSYDYGNSIAVDGSGNVYVIGRFNSTTLTLNNGKSLTGGGTNNYDIFLAKYNSSGICHWAEKIAGSSMDSGNSIAVDDSGNVYIAGDFHSGTLYFNNSKTLTNSTSSYDAYIAKYNSSGVCQWAQKISGTDDEYSRSIAVDDSGNVYIAGNYNSSLLTFNNGKTLTNSGGDDGYIAKYNSSGICQWAQNFSTNPGSVLALSIAVDGSGNVYVTGYWTGSSSTLTFNNSKTLTNSNSGYDAYIAKYNSSGLCQWAEKIAGTADDYGKSIAVDGSGNVYVAGYWRNSNLSFNNAKSLLNSTDYFDVFIAYYNSSGLCQWAEKIAGTNHDYPNSIAVDGSGNVYITGYFSSSTLTLNNSKTLSNSGSSDGYIAKYNSSGLCQWAEKIAGSVGFNYSDKRIYLDKFFNLYVTGHFSTSTITFNDSKTLSNSGNADAFIAKYKNVVELKAPLNNQVNISTKPIFRKKNGNILILSSDSTFKTNVEEYSSPYEYFTYPHNLKNNTKYYVLTDSGYFSFTTEPVRTTTPWEWRNPTPHGNHNRISKYFDDGRMLVLGDLLTIMSSTDGGNNWNQKKTGNGNNINSVHFPPYEDIGFAASDNGTIYKTTDRGSTWTTIDAGVTKPLTNVWMADINAGWCVGKEGKIVKTTDGGSTWGTQNTNTTKNLWGICFANLNVGYIVGDSGVARKTTDGGVNWDTLDLGTTKNLLGTYYTSMSNGIAFGEGGTMLKTTDGGDTWTSISMGTTKAIRGVSFASSSVAYAVGDSGKIYKTTNGGTNWTLQANELTDDLYSVSFYDANNGIAGGANGAILKTTNGGTTWSSMLTDVIGNKKLNFVRFADTLNGAIFNSPSDRYMKSTNGGSSWFNQSIGYKVNHFYFVDGSTGFAVGDTGKVYKTTDNGINWVEKNSNTTVNLKWTDFISSTVGWLVGDNGYLLKTTNGGNSFFSQNVGTTNYYTYVNFIDANTGWILTKGGKILKSTNGGSNWSEQTNPTDTAIVALQILQSHLGWGISDDSYLIRTVNGGTTWTKINTGFTRLKNVFFVDSLNGWASGDRIIRTFDGGLTWQEQSGTTINPIYGLYFKDISDGWAVGDRGTILKYDNSAIVVLPPALSTPGNNSTNASLVPQFTWTKPNNAEWYRLQISDNVNFTTFKYNDTLDTNIFKLPVSMKLDSVSNYYWRVKAYSEIDSSVFSNTFKFTTQGRLMPPSLSSPTNNATGVSINPTFTWNSATNAEKYVLQISKSVTFSNLVVNDTITGTSRAIQVALDGTTNYYWRMMSLNEGQASEWANYRIFTTEYIGLPVPSLTSPSDLATSVAINPTLTWNSVAGATSYRVQLSTSQDFNNLTVSTTVSTTNHGLSNLNYFTSYYWRIRAINSTDSSNWSSARTFKTKDQPLNQVILSSPANNATAIAINPTLIWNSLSGATKYDIQVSTNSNFTSTLINVTDHTSNSYNASGLSNLTTYYWRIRGKNNTETGSWSDVWNFRTISEPLAAPTLTSPSNSASAVSTSPTFQWNNISGATNYELQVSTNSNFTTTIINQTSLTSTSYAGSGLQYLQTYYWRTKAKNTEQTSNWSSVFSFTTKDQPLAQVVLSTPTNNATGVSISPTITWNALSGANNYDIQVATDANFSNIVANVTGNIGTNYNLNNLATFTYHYWRVRGKNTTETGAWSDVWNFRTVSDPIGTPTLSTPTNSATNVSISPTFQWSSVTGATNYELQVSTSSNFTTTLINETSLTSTSYAGSGLSNSTQYYWRARAKNSEQTGSWSSVFNFTTVPAAPIAPTLTSPSNNAVDIATNVTLNWSAVSGATTYKVQVSSDANFATLKIDAANLSSTSYSNSGLDRSTKYYWRAKAVNVGGESDWSTVWNFTTIASEAVPSSWAFTDFTGSNSTVLVPKNINPKIDTRDFQKGDAVGFFFTRNGALVCAGYGVWNNANMAVTVWGDDSETEIKDGFASNEGYTIKIWDGQLGKEMNSEFTVASGNPYFTSDGFTTLASLKGVSTTTHAIYLKSGWNLMSSYVIPTNDSLENIWSILEDKLIISKNNAGQVFIPSYNINSIGKWNHKEAYKSYLNTGDTLKINGLAVNPSNESIIINSGWGLISYLRSSTKDISECLTTLTETSSLLIAKNNAGQVYIPSYDINSIGNMIPGQGYQMYLSKKDTLVYPANGAGRTAPSELTPMAKYILPEYIETGNSAVLLLEIEGNNGDEIAVYNENNQVIGSGVIHRNKAAITIWGDNERTSEIDGAKINDELRIMNYDVKTGRMSEVKINDLFDVVTNNNIKDLNYSKDAFFVAKAKVLDNNSNLSMQVNPNPASDYIDITLKGESEYSTLMIFSNNGKQIADLSSELLTMSGNKLRYNTTNLSSGTYNLILNNGTDKIMKQIMIVK